MFVRQLVEKYFVKAVEIHSSGNDDLGKEAQSGQLDGGESAKMVNSATGKSGADVAADLKKKRATYRGKITRAINRVRRFIEKGAESRKKIEKEFTQIQKDFDLAR